MRKMKQKTKNDIIRQLVRDYLDTNAKEVYAGHVHIQEVVAVVRGILGEVHGARLSSVNIRDVYGYIQEYGPVGEHDLKWLSERTVLIG